MNIYVYRNASLRVDLDSNQLYYLESTRGRVASPYKKLTSSNRINCLKKTKIEIIEFSVSSCMSK